MREQEVLVYGLRPWLEWKIIACECVCVFIDWSQMYIVYVCVVSRNVVDVCSCM